MDADAARHALAGERERLERDLAHLRGDMGAEPRDSAERLDAGPDDAVATYDHEFDEGVAEDLEAAIAKMTARRGEIDQQLASPALARDRAKLDKLVQERAKLETDLAAHEEAWLRKAESA